MHLKLVGAGTLEQPACLLNEVQSWHCWLRVSARTWSLWFSHRMSETRKARDRGLMLTTFACLQGKRLSTGNQDE